MTQIFKNNASSRLVLPMAQVDTSLRVLPGEGAKFPQPTGSDFFSVTIEDRRTGQMEICRCTARNLDILTVVRGQEGTNVHAFAIGATVSNRMTAKTLNDYIAGTFTQNEADDLYINTTGDKMTGALELKYTAGQTPPSLTEAVNRDYVDRRVQQVVSSTMWIGDTPPPAPYHGQEWWESDTGDHFIYFNDGNSSQWVQINIDSGSVGAPLDSPGFLGDPTAPTAPPGDNDLSIANTAFVTNAVGTAVSTIRGTATTSMDTLGEIEAVVNAHTTSLTTKANIAGQTFTGKVTTPTSATGSAGFSLGPAGTAPSVPVTGDMWATSTSLFVRAGSTSQELATLNTTQTFAAAKTFSAKATMLTPTTASASIRLPPGVAPTTPVDGDMWTTSAGLYARIAGVTVGPLGSTADWNTITGKPATFPPTLPITEADVTNLTTDLAAKAALAGATFTGKVVTPAVSVQAGFALNASFGTPSSPAAGDMWIVSDTLMYRGMSVTQKFVATLDTAQSWAAKQTFQPSATTAASIRLDPTGVAPTSPANGDMWALSTGLYVRINGVTIGPLAAAASGGISDAPNDGLTYARKSLGWINISATAGISEAPTDGKTYARQNATWNDLTDDFAAKAATVHTHPQSDVTNLTTDLALLAPKASPALTGVPTVPTAAQATNTTQAASTAFVQTNMALKASVTHTHAQSDVTNLTSDLALKAPLASPIFTGDPQAPTPAVGDNDTSIATTAFVKGQGYAALAGATFTGKVTVPPSATTAGINIGGSGAAPSSGVDGDIWMTASAHGYRVGGVNYSVANLEQAQTFVGQKTFTAKTLFPVGTTGAAPIILPHGAAPAAPVNGDVWTTSAGVFAQINGATVGPFGQAEAAAAILTKLLTVDGTGSGLDADLLDGQSSAYYRDATNFNAGTVANGRLPGRLQVNASVLSTGSPALSTFIETGWYPVMSDTPDAPSAGATGVIMVVRRFDHILQISYRSTAAYESWFRFSSDIGATFSPWERLPDKIFSDRFYMRNPQYSISSASGVPSSGSIRCGSVTPASVVSITINNIDSNGFDRASKNLLRLTAGARLYLEDTSPVTDWAEFKVTGPAVDSGAGYVTVPVSLIVASTVMPSATSFMTITPAPAP